jgi:hypothetical protein
MSRNWQQFAVMATTAMLVMGCEKKEEWIVMKASDIQQNQQQGAAQQSQDTPSSSASNSQAERDVFLNKARLDIDELRNKIDALTVKAKNSSSDLRAALDKQNAGFQNDLKAVELKWQEAKTASVAKWKDLKKSLNDSLGQLKQSVDKASG